MREVVAERSEYFRLRQMKADGAIETVCPVRKAYVCFATPTVLYVTYIWARRAFPRYTIAIVHFGVSTSQRTRIYQSFQTSPAVNIQSDIGCSAQFIFTTLKLGSFGLNLTKANYVFIVELYLSKKYEEQAFGRVHRERQMGETILRLFYSSDNPAERIVVNRQTYRLITNIDIR